MGTAMMIAAEVVTVMMMTAMIAAAVVTMMMTVMIAVAVGIAPTTVMIVADEALSIVNRDYEQFCSGQFHHSHPRQMRDDGLIVEPIRHCCIDVRRGTQEMLGLYRR